MLNDNIKDCVKNLKIFFELLYILIFNVTKYNTHNDYFDYLLNIVVYTGRITRIHHYIIIIDKYIILIYIVML